MIGAVSAASADTLGRIEPDLSDWVSMLEWDGYHINAFDISQLTDTTWNIEFQIREYAGDSLVTSNKVGYRFVFPNRRMVTDFPEELRSKIKESDMYSPEKGIYTAAEKITLSVKPQNDKHQLPVRISVVGMGSYSQTLLLQPIEDKAADREVYWYEPRPFTTDGFKEGEFTPLLLIGSAWYDPEFKIVRFCGEDEIDPEFKANILKDIPHYYVVGAIFTKK